jgi:hypothetical protein
MSGPMNGKKPKPAVLDKPRARRDASKMLAVALQTRYRKLLEASGEDEIVMATVDLSQCMYENIEFVIWALKVQGGMNPPPPEQLHKITPLKQPANDDPRFAKPPALELAEELNVCMSPNCVNKEPHEIGSADCTVRCTCPPLEHGIIGREKHMTSCPKYVP